MRKGIRQSIFWVLGCVMLMAGTGGAQSLADFGDLPDPGFPTYRNSVSGVSGRVGPYHLDVTHEWIGAIPSCTTTTEPDAKPSDEDDGLIEIENVRLDGRFVRTGRVSVSVTTDSSPAVRYLNVAADMNGDGMFRTFAWGSTFQYEWLVVNLPIVFKGETKMVCSLFTLSAPVMTASHVRITLTTEKISPSVFGSNGWDGSGPAGGFARGETEDHFGVPITESNFELMSSGVNLIPPIMPKPPFPPPIPPQPKKGESIPPRGPVTEIPVEEAPQRPGEGLQPYTPETPAPERLDEPEPNPVVDSASNTGVPDIKQGPNECVPAATANSMRYLLDKSGQPPQDGDAFNKDLFNKLKAAMKTTSAAGTNMATDNPQENDFLKGKTKAQITGALRNAKVTSAESNPSMENICEAVKAGHDVEIVITCYDKNGVAVGRHMVTVVGYVKKSDGTIELKIHDPNNKRPGDQPGDTVKPPRESTIVLAPKAGGAPGKGGVAVKGMTRDEHDPNVDDDGDTFVIDHLFVERLAQQGVPVNATCTPEVVHENDRVTLSAQAGGKGAGLLYQWSKDDVDLEGITGPVCEIPAATSADNGVYTCYVYDQTTETWGISEEIEIHVQEGPHVPAAYWPGLLFLGVGMAWLAGRKMRKP